MASAEYMPSMYDFGPNSEAFGEPTDLEEITLKEAVKPHPKRAAGRIALTAAALLIGTGFVAHLKPHGIEGLPTSHPTYLVAMGNGEFGVNPDQNEQDQQLYQVVSFTLNHQPKSQQATENDVYMRDSQGDLVICKAKDLQDALGNRDVYALLVAGPQVPNAAATGEIPGIIVNNSTQGVWIQFVDKNREPINPIDGTPIDSTSKVLYAAAGGGFNLLDQNYNLIKIMPLTADTSHSASVNANLRATLAKRQAAAKGEKA